MRQRREPASRGPVLVELTRDDDVEPPIDLLDAADVIVDDLQRRGPHRARRAPPATSRRAPGRLDDVGPLADASRGIASACGSEAQMSMIRAAAGRVEPRAGYSGRRAARYVSFRPSQAPRPPSTRAVMPQTPSPSTGYAA